jgi:hypothetical protein
MWSGRPSSDTLDADREIWCRLVLIREGLVPVSSVDPCELHPAGECPVRKEAA